MFLTKNIDEVKILFIVNTLQLKLKFSLWMRWWFLSCLGSWAPSLKAVCGLRCEFSSQISRVAPPSPHTRHHRPDRGRAGKQCHECASNISNHSQISNGQQCQTGPEWNTFVWIWLDWPYRNMKCIFFNKVVIHRETFSFLTAAINALHWLFIVTKLLWTIKLNI